MEENMTKHVKKIIAAFPVFLLSFAFIVFGSVLTVTSCTKEQRAIVHTVVDIVDMVCGDNDSVDDCLGKAQAARAAARVSGAASAPPAPATSSSPSASPDAGVAP